jgi:ATP-binding cassette, subfamily A (ABC1), member 3
MTVQEHLELYADIKGVKSTIRDTLIQKQIKEMDLTSYANVQA